MNLEFQGNSISSADIEIKLFCPIGLLRANRQEFITLFFSSQFLVMSSHGY